MNAKPIKLYNMVFPITFVFMFSPLLWGITVFGDLIIDAAVLAVISLCVFKGFDLRLFKPCFLKVYLFGFLADFIGVTHLVFIKKWIGVLTENGKPDASSKYLYNPFYGTEDIY